jgi:translation initiation factor SUI1
MNLEEELNIAHLEVHLKIKKRTGRTHLTSVEGLDKIERPEGMELDVFLKKITKIFKKKFMCGAFIEDNIIVLNGDHRQGIKELLISQNITTEHQVKIHGC